MIAHSLSTDSRPTVPPRGGNGLLAAAGILAVSGLASRTLGLLRDRLLASHFGAGEILDAYFAAFRIPDLVYNLLILGALSAALLPVMNRYLAEGEEGQSRAFRTANSLLSLGGVILAVLAGFFFLLAPVFVRLLTPGFSAINQHLAVDLTRIMLLQPILLGVSGVVSSVLLSFERFLAYAAAPVVYNVGIMVGILVFVPLVGHQGLAWGVVLGALFHILVQLPALRRTGFRFRPSLALRDSGLHELWRLFFPRLVSVVATQVGAVIVTVVGSLLAAGSISAFVLAENIQAVPVGLVGTSFGVAAFPLLARAAAGQNLSEFLGTLTRAYRLIFAVALPASVSLVLLRAQVVRVMLGAGAFDWTDTTMTFTILSILALSIVAQSLIPLLVRAFFALHDTRTPMLIGLVVIGLHILTAFVLTPSLGVAGLAWAFTIASLTNFFALLMVLHSRLGHLNDGDLLKSCGRVALATLVAGFIVQGPAFLLARLGVDLSRVPEFLLPLLFGLKGLIASMVNMQTFVGVATQLLGSLLGGFLIYFIVAMLLGSPEVSSVYRSLARFRHYRSAFPSKVPSSSQLTEYP